MALVNPEIIKGDITKIATDAIVNAANSSLLGGGGVDGAIHRAGGPAILDACREIRTIQGECPPGEAVITTGGKLPARYVIHAVGPVWHGGHRGEPDLLASCYQKSLRVAVANHLKSIAFPSISTGVYSYPKDKAAKVAVETVKLFLKQEEHELERVLFICFDDESYRIYKELLG
ncbi:O-acetyl-ADP-ribose deacetylase [Pontibacter sp. 13R65]|uniref:O-acetyl-ADP-ribose deacetylase n=1 Tax=Pontibacter sp. 13R65 TaxID=3127458 RepID=UPI00301BBC10